MSYVKDLGRVCPLRALVYVRYRCAFRFVACTVVIFAWFSWCLVLTEGLPFPNCFSMIDSICVLANWSKH